MKISYFNSNLKFFLLFFLIFLTFITCKDKNEIIPFVPVNIYIDIIPELSDLGIGNSVYITGGVNGIIIFRKSLNEYLAFERTCTYQPGKNCAVEIDESAIIPKCPCCFSKFLLSAEGSVIEGPAVMPLKQYQTSLVGNSLHIYN